jgi:hypothetical protein
MGSCLQVGNITKSHKESHIEKEEKRFRRMCVYKDTERVEKNMSDTDKIKNYSRYTSEM